MIRYTAFLEGLAKIICNIIFDTHSGKYNGKLLIAAVSQRRLLHNLRRQPVVGKSVSGENRQLLSPNQRCQSVDGRNTGADIVSRIKTGNRIQRQTIDVSADIGVNRPQSVNGNADTVKGPSQHIFRKRYLHGVPRQTGSGIFQGQPFGSLKHLNQDLVLICCDNTAQFFLFFRNLELHDLIKGGVFHTFQYNQGTIDFA